MSRAEATVTKQTKEVANTAEHHNHHHPKSDSEIFLLVCSQLKTELNFNWKIQQPGEAKTSVASQNKNGGSHREQHLCQLLIHTYSLLIHYYYAGDTSWCEQLIVINSPDTAGIMNELHLSPEKHSKMYSYKC